MILPERAELDAVMFTGGRIFKGRRRRDGFVGSNVLFFGVKESWLPNTRKSTNYSTSILQFVEERVYHAAAIEFQRCLVA